MEQDSHLVFTATTKTNNYFYVCTHQLDKIKALSSPLFTFALRLLLYHTDFYILLLHFKVY